MDDTKTQALVVDNGSGMVKAGFAGDKEPCAVFPPNVFKSKHPSATMSGIEQTDAYVGNEAKSKDLLSLEYPVNKDGMVTNWGNMEKIWHHIFYDELEIQPEEHAVLLTEAPMNPKANREKMTQIMFETFNTQALYIASQPLLSLYGSGKTSGIVIDAAQESTQIVPVHNCYVIDSAIKNCDIFGSLLSDHVFNVISKYGHFSRIYSNIPYDWAQPIKERLGYVAKNGLSDELAKTASKSKSQSSFNMKSYRLPDNNIIKINRGRCSSFIEPYFQPRLIDESFKDIDSIDQLLYDSIMECDVDIRDDLCNIMLLGDSSVYPGFDKRLHKQLSSLLPPGMNVTMLIPESKTDAPWVGGSIMAELSSFQPMWISKDDYENEHQQCVFQRNGNLDSLTDVNNNNNNNDNNGFNLKSNLGGARLEKLDNK